ncbi:Copper chaperone CopZ [Pedobacter steynii]|uniref:Copper chaperone CopZ n=1 Tax=Pedobacter steynii TaxID=430522 RepID=A0A1G9IS41_9SPHI|nr:heavy metal-associated domain-containing protein [Pedobacter steynii]NQX38034.1 heavy-metal-associated domain-containing protein [Pedobacter steynii]SDL28139.1 Copper chaperone CopZ [Pedobacter steynii]
METLKFKTTIKCEGCIATVTPHLNNLSEISKWEVDTTSPDKILTVEGNESLDAQVIKDTLNKAGYAAEKI